MKLNKTKINITIDILMFLDLMAITGIGFLMRYVLLPGYLRKDVYGSGAELYFWGLDRHEWGEVHLITGYVLLVLLVLHIVFHWNQVLAFFRKLIPGRVARAAVYIIIVVLTLLLGVAPLFVKPEVVRGNESHDHHAEHHSPDAVHHSEKVPEGYVQNGPKAVERNQNHSKSIDVNGKMTIKEVSVLYAVPVNDMLQYLDIPASEVNERLGRLKKKYGFEMHEFSEFVEQQISAQ